MVLCIGMLMMGTLLQVCLREQLIMLLLKMMELLLELSDLALE